MEKNQTKTIMFPPDPKIWQQIKEILEIISQGIKNYTELCDNLSKILLIKQIEKYQLKSLEKFLENNQKKEYYFTKLIPFIAKQALELEKLFPEPIQYLYQTSNQSIELSKLQICCLLSNFFFFTFEQKYDSNSSQLILEDHSFLLYFQYVYEKIPFIFNYFERMETGDLEATKTSKIIIERVYFPPSSFTHLTEDFYLKSKLPLTSLKVYFQFIFILNQVTTDTFIEDYPTALQVDFANCRLGGGCMGGGNVQEEIRFCISPELIATRLFVDEMNDNECILLKGCSQYSEYQGYGGTFCFKGDFLDKNPDSWIVALDAVNFLISGPQFQFQKNYILRELSKLYVGFTGSQTLKAFEQENNCKKPIATGNWGCGAFLGNHQLKFILQWIVASLAEREIIYSTFGDKHLNGAEKIMELYKGKNVEEIAGYLWEFMEQRYKPPINFKLGLFEFLEKKLVK